MHLGFQVAQGGEVSLGRSTRRHPAAIGFRPGWVFSVDSGTCGWPVRELPHGSGVKKRTAER